MSQTSYISAPPQMNLPAGEYTTVVPKKGLLIDQAAVGLWFLTTFFPFPGDQFLLYPLAGYFVAAIALKRQEVVPVALKSWPLFLIPTLTTLSMFWAASSNAAMKLGVFMFLTVAIAIYIAVRLSPRQIIQAIFVVGAVLILLTVTTVGLDGLPFVTPEKNLFANKIMISLVACLAVMFDRQSGFILRSIAAPIAAMGFIMVVNAGSATSLIMSMASIVVLGSVWLFWSRVGAIQHLRSFLLMMGAAVALLAVLVVMNMPENSLFASFLDAFGKDTTLTGRTMLWDAADRITDERPWLGVGAESFWIYNRGDAQTLLELSFKDPGTRFSFHNSYLETQVHVGYVGLIFLVIMVVWSMFQSIRGWLFRQQIDRSFFLLISFIVLITSFTESILFGAFETSVTIFYVAAVLTISRQVRTLSFEVTEAEPQRASS